MWSSPTGGGHADKPRTALPPRRERMKKTLTATCAAAVTVAPLMAFAPAAAGGMPTPDHHRALSLHAKLDPFKVNKVHGSGTVTVSGRVRKGTYRPGERGCRSPAVGYPATGACGLQESHGSRRRPGRSRSYASCAGVSGSPLAIQQSARWTRPRFGRPAGTHRHWMHQRGVWSTSPRGWPNSAAWISRRTEARRTRSSRSSVRRRGRSSGNGTSTMCSILRGC